MNINYFIIERIWIKWNDNFLQNKIVITDLTIFSRMSNEIARHKVVNKQMVLEQKLLPIYTFRTQSTALMKTRNGTARAEARSIFYS